MPTNALILLRRHFIKAYVTVTYSDISARVWKKDKSTCEHLKSSDGFKEHGRENGGDLLKSNDRKDSFVHLKYRLR